MESINYRLIMGTAHSSKPMAHGSWPRAAGPAAGAWGRVGLELGTGTGAHPWATGAGPAPLGHEP